MTTNAKLLRQVRARFANVSSDPFTGQRIYLENAGGSLKLKSIFPVIETLTALPDNGGRNNPASQALDAAMADGRAAIATFVGAKSGQIIAEQSTTSMLFRLLRTIARSGKGNNIVTTNLDHASTFDAAHTIAKQYGWECRVAALDPQTGVVPVEAVAEKIDRQTVLLSVIHSSNIVGSVNPVREIVQAARRINPNVFIIIDGAQHASHGLVDVAAYGADAYVFVAYKTFAKLGISFAHLSDRLAALPHDQLRGKPPTVWDLGTREVSAYACMRPVVDYLQWLAQTDGQKVAGARAGVVKGMGVVERLELELMRAFLHGTGGLPGLLKMKGITVYGQTSKLDQREAIFAFNLRDHPTAALVEHFRKHNIILHNRVSDAYSKHTLAGLGIEECMRVSACHYNTPAEIGRFLEVLSRA